MFHVGDKVIYPLQGVAQVEGVESKLIFGSEQQKFYILKILNNNTTIMVPVANAEDIGLRGLISPEDVDKVVDILKGKGEPMAANWAKRYRDNLDRLKTGSIFQLASVMRDLVLMKRSKELSFGEKKMLDNVKSLIVDEISYVQNISNSNVEKRLFQVIGELQQ